jgi:predicted permease
VLTVINALGPVIVMTSIGWALRWRAFLTNVDLQTITRLVYWLGIPALLFVKVATAPASLAAASTLLIVLIATTLTGVGVALLIAGWLRVPGRDVGTFVQAVYRGNLAFVGVPVVAYSAADLGQVGIESVALLTLGPMVVLYNFLGVLVLLLSRGRLSSKTILPILRSIAFNPLLLSCALGLLYRLTGWPMPVLAQRTLEAVGQMALPLALICIGGALFGARLRAVLSRTVSAAVGKTLLMPAAGLLIGWLMGLEDDAMRMVLIFMACPTAGASYVMVRQIGGDVDLASSAVAASTILAIPVLALVLALA